MISVVIPTYQERANIEPLISRISRVISQISEPLEAIVVDDDSPDGTADEVRRLQPNCPWLRLVQRTRDRDLSRAVIAGWQEARGDVLGVMDADLQHPPEILPALASHLRDDNADMVVASRYTSGGGVGNWSKIRQMASHSAMLLASLALPYKLRSVTDPMSGFFLVRRASANIPELHPRGYKILVEVLARGACAQIEEVPFEFATRNRGESKATLRTALEFFRQIGQLALATGEVARMVKFALVGLSGVGVNFLAFWLMRRSGWTVPLAAASAGAIAVANNFVFNEIYTFREVHQSDSGMRSMSRRLLLFAAISLVGLGINTAVASALVHFLWWPFALGLAIASATGWNFLANSRMTWRGTQPKRLIRSEPIAESDASSASQ